MPNEQGGAIQVLDNSTEAINQALAQLLERVDDLKGLRGPVTVHDRLEVLAPLNPLDAVNLDTLVGDFLEQSAQPFIWRALGNTQRPSEMQGEDSELNVADPLLWLVTDRFVTPEDPELNLHDPFLWLFGTTVLSLGFGGEPENAPPVVAAASAIGAVLERYAAEDHTHGITTDTFTVTGTGFVDPDPTGTAVYVVVAGRFAIVFLPQLTGTSDATTFTLTGIPAAIQPATLSGWIGTVSVFNAGTITTGFIKVNAASGTWDVFRVTGVGTWTASSTKTLEPTWIAYNLL